MDNPGRLFLDALVAFVVGWASIGWLLRYVGRHSFGAFGVYWTRQWPQRVGLVALISLGDGKLHYEYRRPGDYHDQVCQKCGQQIQIPDEHLTTLKADLQQRYGFMLDVDHLALPGRCAGRVAGEAAAGEAA